MRVSDQALRSEIAENLRGLGKGELRAQAEVLLNTLGYRSEKTFDLSPNTFEAFASEVDRDHRINPKNALPEEWKSVDLLFQITDDEITGSTQGRLGFDGSRQVDNSVMNSYLFFAVELRGQHYTRTQLAGITREINKAPDMPALVLFRHGDTVTFSVINRRLHKRDAWKDVLEKVTLIKDIRFDQPHRAHIEILFDLSLGQLHQNHKVTNFVELHNAWQKTLDSSELNKRFFRELANWYFWAQQHVTFPKAAGKNEEERNATSVIRLITRLIFVWFIKEKGLVPDDLFNERRVKELLKSTDPKDSSFYKAILQNLFFGTLNTEMDKRKWRGKRTDPKSRSQHYMTHNLCRYEDHFKDPQGFLDLCGTIPFLNGGLFECLDKEGEKHGKNDIVRIDGFSDREDNEVKVPNFLFFSPEQTVDLNDAFGTTNRKHTVRGLIDLLGRYKFTIDENTPIEEEIALDPELLGKVFENLLAAYNPETGVTARKQTGSFYTPREIVNYMVDESLLAYFEASLKQAGLPVSHDVTQTILSVSDTHTPTTTSFEPFDTDGEVLRTRRRLPHWIQAGKTYYVTFRLADSLPQEKLRQWIEDRNLWLDSHPRPWSDEEELQYEKRFSDSIEKWLDQGYGSCVLRRPEVRSIVERCLRHFDGQRYDLDDFVIMPNHIHVLITPREGFELSNILKGIKGVSAHDCNRLLGKKGTFWMDESFDHIVRNFDQLEGYRHYIAENPYKANLSPEEFTYYECPVGNVSQAILPVSPDSPVSAQDEAQTEVSESQASQAGLPVSQEQTGLSASLRQLFSYTDEPHQLSEEEVKKLIEAIDSIKVLDPACGSGAFPMGLLNKLVLVLRKLDPDNSRWKALQVARANTLTDAKERAAELADIEEVFANEPDYARKFYLIENCLYGVDIQPIAVQIAKLRCFISLIVDDAVDEAAPNRGILPLPNLEARFVAANSLISVDKPQQMGLGDDLVAEKEKELREVRRRIFTARTRATKDKWRERDKQLRAEISQLLKDSGYPSDTAKRLTTWDPYNQNTSADFFDPEWMFGVQEGFNVVIGNPPYVDSEQMVRTSADQRTVLAARYLTAKGNWDLYIPFWERSVGLTSSIDGTTTLITPNKWLSIGYGKVLRQFSRPFAYKFVDYSRFRVFESVGVFPVVVFMSRVPRSFVDIEHYEENHVLCYKIELPKSTAERFENWGVFLSRNIDMVSEIVERSQKLSDFCSVEEAFTVSEAYEFADILEEVPSPTREHFRFLNTGTIDRYTTLWGLKPTTYLKTKYMRPAVRKKLFKSRFERRFLQTSSTKIVISGIRHFEAFLDKPGEWIAGKSTVVVRDFRNGATPEGLLAILNSKLVSFFLHECYASLAMDGGINFSPANVSEIPIPNVVWTQEQPFTALVDLILAAKGEDPSADTTAWEREIDRLVYDLYGLTEEEIAVVEGNSEG